MHSGIHPVAAIMLDALWQSSLCLAAGLAAAAALSRRPARAHAILLVAIVAAIAAPATTAIFRWLGWGLFEPAHIVARAALPPPPGGSTASGAAGLVLPEVPAILGALWLVVSVIFVARLAGSMARGARLAGAARPVASPQLYAVARGAAERLGLSVPAELCASSSVRCPVIWCWGGAPRILLPGPEAPERSEGLFGVLCHELAHFKRADHVASLLAEFATCLLPWNPMIWFARRRLRQLSEQCCDAWALAAGASPVPYAETLLGLAWQPVRAWSLAAVSGHGGTGQRIVRILQESLGNPDPGARFRVAVAALSVGLVTMTALAQRRHAVETAAPRVAVAPPVSAAPQEPPPPASAAGVHQEAPRHTGVELMPGELDLGRVPAGGARMGSVWLINNGDTPRRVESARASCGCTTVHAFQPTTLQPGESMMVELTMTGPDKAGLTKTKYVTFQVEGQAPLRLPVHLMAVEPVN